MEVDHGGGGMIIFRLDNNVLSSKAPAPLAVAWQAEGQTKKAVLVMGKALGKSGAC